MDIRSIWAQVIVNQNLSFGVVTVVSICALLLIANVLRRKIPVFRRALMPTAVIAGLLGLVIKEVVLAVFGFNIFNKITLGGIVYHALPIAFIALCLREKSNYSKEFDKIEVKKERVTAIKSGSVFTSTYLFQGIVGLLVTVFLGLTFMQELNMGTGIILPLAYGQGPQQARATGYIWDMAGIMAPWSEGSGQNYGLAIAALGFIWASIPGIILVNMIAKKRGITRSRNEFQKSGELASHTIEGPDEVPLSESIDKFSLQVCMVGGVYLLTIGLIICIEILFRAIGTEFLINLIPLFWGFAFMIAVLVALCTKLVLRRLVKTGVMHRKYPNNYMMNRISGVAFDLSIASALALISVTALGVLWIPVLIMSTAGGLASIFYLRWITGIVYKDYKDEAFLAFYGTLTGTIANGMILLREIDPNFETPTGDDLVLASSAAVLLGSPLLLLVALAPVNLLLASIIIVLYFSALTFYQIKGVLFKKRKSHGN